MHSSARVVARLARKQCTRGVRTSAVAHRAPTLNAIDLNVRAMKQSQTLAINELSQSLEREGKIVSKFGLGQSPFPVPDVMVKSLMKHAPEKDYLAVAGLAALREAIADWCTRVIGGRDHHADDVYVWHVSACRWECFFSSALACAACAPFVVWCFVCVLRCLAVPLAVVFLGLLV